MLRALFGRPRTIRVPVDKHGIDVQTVRLRRHQTSLPMTRFLAAGAITFFTMQGLRYWDPLGTYQSRDTFQEQLEKAKKEGTLSEKNSPDGKPWDRRIADLSTKSKSNYSKALSVPDSVRLTIPVWIRKGSVRPYDSEDPEFKEFVKLQRDTKRMNDLKRKVTDLFMESVKHTKRLQLEMKIAGFNGTVVQSLDVVPQLFTPPIYEIPCVWLSPKSGTFLFGWRPLTPDTGPKMERVFRPIVLYDASMAAGRVFFATTYAITKARINEYFGLGKGDSATGSRPQISVPQVIARQTTQESSGKARADNTKPLIPVFPYLPDVNDGKGTRKMHQDIVSSMPYSVAIQQAAQIFDRVKSARQRMAVSTNVKGVCQIRGFLILIGDRGKVRVEVALHYLPAEDMFLGGLQVKQSYVVSDYHAVQKEMEEFSKKQKEKQQAGKNPGEQPESPNTDVSEKK